MKSLACYFFAASTWWHVGWRRQHLSFWVFTIFHYERCFHAPTQMAFCMAVHEPHSCNRENIPTLHLTYCNIKKNYFLGMQVGSFKGFFFFLIEDMSACNIPGLDALNLIAAQPFLGTETVF